MSDRFRRRCQIELWERSPSLSLSAVSELLTTTWYPLDKGLSWHMSVSGRPSVAPSIKLVDSCWHHLLLCLISITLPCKHLLKVFQLHMPEQMHAKTHIHIGLETLSCGYSIKSQWLTPTKYYAFILVIFISSLSYVLPSSLSGFFLFTSSSSPPFPSCLPLRSMVSSCST